ncbi:MAG: hypothetical protein JWN72_2905 [Thermoleophilia bacterium]|nr:hypothetical protein [Thermoleophilia bacterium]
MSAISSCCTPCAATPVVPQAPAVAATIAPTTTDAQAPAPVMGGGSAAATYAPLKGEQSTVQYVPAPAANGAAPEPIAVPAQAAPTQTLPATPATTPTQSAPSAGPAGSASALDTWPQWQAEFGKLGLPAADVARIGSQPLTNEQLAHVYQSVHDGAVQGATNTANGTPGTPGTPGAKDTPGAPGQGSTSGADRGWDAAWEQKFLQLGIPAADVAELAKAVQVKGLRGADLDKVYAQAVQQVQQGGTNPSQSAGAAWSEEWTAKFTALGMPPELVQLYQQNTTSAGGTEAAYNTAAEKLADFTERGWTKKFTEAGISPVDMWSIILTDPAPDDKALQSIVNGQRSSKLSGFQKALQTGISFFPGGELLQYVLGKKVVSGNEIDRTNPMNIGLAALSGLALFASVRGVGQLVKGFGAAKGGYENLFKVGDLTKGTAVVADSKLGEVLTWGAGKKLKALVPFTMEHKVLIGGAHAEAAAKAALAETGFAKLLAVKDGVPVVKNGEIIATSLNHLFDDIKTGQRVMTGSAGIFGKLTKMSALPMSTSVAKDGTQLINVARTLRVGDGRTQLAAMAGIAGDLAAANNPALTGLGQLFAGTVASTIGFARTDGLMATRQLGNLAKLSSQGLAPSWYKGASEAATEVASDAAKAPAATAGGTAGSAAKPTAATGSTHVAPAAPGGAPTAPRVTPAASGSTPGETTKLNAKTRHIIEKAIADFNAKTPSYSINRPHTVPTLLDDPKPMGSADLVFSHAD